MEKEFLGQRTEIFFKVFDAYCQVVCLKLYHIIHQPAEHEIGYLIKLLSGLNIVFFLLFLFFNICQFDRKKIRYVNNLNNMSLIIDEPQYYFHMLSDHFISYFVASPCPLFTETFEYEYFVHHICWHFFLFAFCLLSFLWHYMLYL